MYERGIEMKIFEEIQNILCVTGETAVKLTGRWFKKEYIEQTENKEPIENEEESQSVIEVNIEDFPKENGLLLMAFCPHCGIGNPPDRETCVSCGQSL